MIQIMGSAVLLGASFFIWRGYSRHLRREMRAIAAMLSALKDMRDKMTAYLTSPSEWAKKYSCEVLGESGFIDSVRDGDDLLCAYNRSKERLALPASADSLVCELFSHMGEGYLESETAALSFCIDKLDAISKTVSEDIDKKIKVAGAVIGAVGAGIIILII